MRFTRLKRPTDIRRAAQLLAASDPWLTLGLDAAYCRKVLNAPFRETWTAGENGRLAGLVTITMYGTFKGYIQALYVAPDHRGRGTGAALLAFAESKIFRSAGNVFLCVSSFNKGAQKFYRRQGYRKVGVLKDFVVKGQDEILLRKTTGPARQRKSCKTNK